MDQRQAIKVAGALSGVVFVNSFDDTVATLKAEIARLLGAPDAAGLKLIVGGRILSDGNATLASYKVTAASKLLVSGRGAEAATGMAAEAARQATMERLKRVMGTFASRDARTSDEFALELENQAGSRMQLSDSDRRAIVMGLALHDMGKAAMAKAKWAEAIDRLTAAEEALGCVQDGELLKGIDNLGILLLDITWCYYKLGDVSRLGVARDRLARARAALASAHGPNMERVRALHGGRFTPEVAIYARLEALEVVVAYHTGDLAAAAEHLAKARARLTALQVPDAPLAMLQEMGFTPSEARRALRFSGGDMDGALTFVSQQREAVQARRQRNRTDAAWREERKKYGRTGKGQYVERDMLQRLTDMGYDKVVAAEALRSLDNAFNAALETLMDPAKRAAITLAASLRQVVPTQPKKKAKPAAGTASTSGAGASTAGAAGASTSGGGEGGSGAAGGSGGGDVVMSDEAVARAAQEAEAEEEARRLQAEEYGEAPSGQQQGQGEEGEGDEALQYKQKTASDEEMEEEVRATLNSDPFAAYDIDCGDESELVDVFAALIESARGGGAAVSAGAGGAGPSTA